MRETIQTLGRLNTVILITAISVFASVFITFMAFYLRQNGGITHMAIFLASFIPLTVSPLVSWHLMGLLMKIDKLEKEMRKLASLDPLTELFNRRAFFNDANLSIRRAEQERRVVSVIALDLDRFR